MSNESGSADFEQILGRHMTFAMSRRSRTAIDRRIRAAIVAEARRRPTSVRSAHKVSLRGVLVGVGLTALLLAGTVTAGGTLLSRLVWGAPLLEDVWARSTDIGRSVSDRGYTVALVKAAAEVDRVWVALSVASDSGTGADIWDMRITDANGVVMAGGTGVGSGIVRGVSASLFGFQVPKGVTPRGPYLFEVTKLDVGGRALAGSWVIRFDVPLTAASKR